MPNDKSFDTVIKKLFDVIESLMPAYMENSVDSSIANGNCAVCVIDENGGIHGKMFGTNKARQRQSFKVAWIKASQVWLTGYKTGEYERMVFNKEVEENGNGIEAPDLIGWQGGQPFTLVTDQNFLLDLVVLEESLIWKLW